MGESAIATVFKMTNSIFSVRAQSLGNSSKSQIFAQFIAERLPEKILGAVANLMTEKFKYIRQARNTIDSVAAEVMAEWRAGAMNGSGDGRDLMSLLLRANAGEDEKLRLSDEELIAEIRWAGYSPKFLPSTHARAHSTIIFVGCTFHVAVESPFHLTTFSHRRHYCLRSFVRALGAGKKP